MIPIGLMPSNWCGRAVSCEVIHRVPNRLEQSKSLTPISIVPQSDTRAVIDLGQNASFMPRITVTGPTGSTVRLTHAEVLDEDGNIDRSTCGGNRGGAWWQYTKGTDGEETWFPQFFYAGCRVSATR